MDDRKPFRAFISYSHRDKMWGEWLHRRLESYRVPAKIVGRDTPFGPIPSQLAPIFRDRDELATATDLSAEIAGALAHSMFLVVLCSPAAAASRWVNEEIKTFKRLHGEGRVHALIVDGEPFSGDPATECFPEALRFRVGADGEMTTAPAEPIAADVRAGGDGKKYAISKLVAGLTGARLDELVRREQQRRAARLRWVAAGLLLLVLVLSGLTFDALRQRNAARVAQAEAEIQRNDAEFQRNEAQNLVEYMLTDLRDKLNAVGRLDVLESVGKRLAESYAKQDLSKLDPDALGRRARVQLLLGEVENTKGDLDSALVRYQEAAATTEEQLRRDPDNPQRIFDHAQSVFWVGYIAWQRGDAVAAKEYWSRYYGYAQRLVAIDPENDEWQMELKYANSNLGTLALDQGEAEEAESYFRDSLEIAKRLVGKRPDDADRIIAQGQAYAWLADAYYFQMKFNEVEATRSAEIALYDKAGSSGHENAIMQTSALIARYSLAQLGLASNRIEFAVSQALEASREADALTALDPDSTEIADRAAFANAVLGEALFYAHHPREARVTLEKALDIATRLTKTNKTVAKWKGNGLAQATLALARLDADEGNRRTALKRLDDLLHELQSLLDAKEASQVMVRRYCEALAARAHISPAFASSWDQIIAVVTAQQHTQWPEALALLAEAYAETGKSAKASEVALNLYVSGYRHPDFLALIAAHPQLIKERGATAAVGSP